MGACFSNPATEFGRQFAEAMAAQEAPTNTALQYAIPVLSLGLGLAGWWWLATRRKVAVTEKAAAVLMADAAAAYKLAKNAGQAQTLAGAALQFGQQFEQTTPMLVMPFGVFKAQGRIMKSTQVWRDGALAAGSLVVYEGGSGKVVIFVSHTWWDRGFKDATNDPNDKYDKGAPDFQANYPEEQRKDRRGKMVTYQRPKDRKWR
eukprot:scaffold62732_cov61-Phaeocystis_antarctica.AAC.2